MIQTCLGFGSLVFEICLACDELPSACSGPEPVEGSRVEFEFCYLGFNRLYFSKERFIQ
jgi:hypothetical protein